MKRFIILLSGLLLFLGCTQKGQEQQYADTGLSVITFNIRYDNPNDAPHDWAHRRDAVASWLLQHQPHILGMQEVLHNQLEDLKERMPQFTYIGVGREDGKTQGEYAPIAYDSQRLELLTHRYIWLSETPQMPSKGWDAACERIATIAVLRDKLRGDTLGVINTHFDHVGEAARKHSVKLIHREVATLKDMYQGGVIVMGDLNAIPEDAVMLSMLDSTVSPRLFDSGFTTHESFENRGTYHDFNREPLKQQPLIDYILYTAPLTPKSYKILPTTDAPELLLSDHHAVYTQF